MFNFTLILLVDKYIPNWYTIEHIKVGLLCFNIDYNLLYWYYSM